MALTKEKLALQRAYRANGNDKTALKRDVELHAAGSAKADAQRNIEIATEARDKILKELEKVQRELSKLDRSAFGGRFKDMQLQGKIVQIETRLERARNDYENAAAALERIEAEAKAARIQFWKHKTGAEYLESLGRRKRIEQALLKLEPLQDDPEIKPLIIEKEAQLRGIDNLHIAALQEWRDTYMLLTGCDIESEGVPSEDELNPKPVNQNLHGRPRASRRLIKEYQ
jgi:chromosome segregation ATPase